MNDLARTVSRKVAWRVLPLVFLLYIVAYLDRANVGFAKLRMQDDLGLSDAVFGWGMGIFFAGYLLLEIPGAILVERWSARKWFARILVSWGACSMAMAFVQTPAQFYLVRFLLGLAEAGFFPGVIVYFTHWFPRAERTRALAGLVLAVPVSLALGARVSGWLLQADWLGYTGWQWVFLVEGAPAVLLGIAVPFLMADRPRDARWLSAAEREWLEGTLARERSEVAAGGGTLREALRGRALWLLGLGILVTNTGGYALVFWLPTAVKGLLADSGRSVTDSAVLDWTGLIYLCGLAGVWVSGQSSDYFRERKWHCITGQVLSGCFLAASAVPGQPWPLVFAWLCLGGFFFVSLAVAVLVLPSMTIPPAALAVSIGTINMCANAAGGLGSPIYGLMKEGGLDDRVCLMFLASCYVLGGVVVAFLRVPPSPKP